MHPQRNRFEMAAHQVQFQPKMIHKPCYPEKSMLEVMMGEDFYQFFPQCRV